MRTRVTIERTLQRRVDLATIYSQVQELNRKALSGSRGRGWSGSISPLREPTANSSGGWVFRAEITYETLQDRLTLNAKFPDIIDKLRESGSSASFQASPWLIVEPKELIHAREINVNPEVRTEENLSIAPPVNLTVTNQFDRIYDREAHIRILIDNAKLAVDTNYRKRCSILLVGPPGSAKSELLKSFGDVLGDEGVHYIMLDQTQSTRAGVVDQLITASILPNWILSEEIEKAPESSLSYLLSITDNRNLVSRNNFRTGQQRRITNMVVVATCNDEQKLQSYLSGALYSRFNLRLFCPHPTREIMEKILIREISDIGGDLSCVEPCLSFGFDKLGIRDPRRLISLILIGRNRLLTGEFQNDILKTIEK